MASLLSLPTELLFRILYYVESYNAHHRGSFYPLSLACKRLNEVAVPMLYRDVVFGPSKIESRQLTPQFVHAVQASGEHASMVKSYTLERGFDVKEPEDMSDPAVYGAFLKRVCENTRQKAKADLIERAFPAVGHVTETYPGLIASLYLPSLEEFRLEGYWGGLFEPFDVISKCIQESSPDERAELDIWPKLQKVVIEGTGEKYPDSTMPLAIFARLPQVECIEASAMADEQDSEEEPLWHIRPSSSGLRKLVLGSSFQLTNLNMRELLRAPKALKDFRYNVGHVWAHIDFSTKALETALQYQSHSLEHLTLSHAYYEYARDYDRNELQPMKFSSFDTLRVLEISPLFVFGDLEVQYDDHGRPGYKPLALAELDTESAKRNLVDMLPSSIQVLRFSRCGGDRAVCLCLSKCLQELASCKRDDGQFGNLRTIELHAPYRCADIQWDAIRPGFEAVRSIGIDAEVYDGGPLSCDEVTESRWGIPERIVEPGETRSGARKN
ncbi:hypothetical protein SLS62_008100 [Diatrype stigma]|uniref:F-box domain-containing protein n=1 Tax=Diatrype stigma TaxID=117547 RepID=A0AAN9YMX3_9PEZI